MSHLSQDEKQVLSAVLFWVQKVLPPTAVEWEDLSVRTKHTPEDSLLILKEIWVKCQAR